MYNNPASASALGAVGVLAATGGLATTSPAVLIMGVAAIAGSAFVYGRLRERKSAA